jgi:hypothetical protein
VELLKDRQIPSETAKEESDAETVTVAEAQVIDFPKRGSGSRPRNCSWAELMRRVFAQ